MRGLIASVVETHRIDILINNAGIMRRYPATDISQEVLDEIMEVNFNGPFILCRDMGRYWIDNKIDGRLINIASLSTFQGGVRMAAYSASKGAVGQLTKALSNEWAQHKIRVNAIAPGYVPNLLFLCTSPALCLPRMPTTCRYIATDMNTDTRNNPDQAYYQSILARIPMGHWGKPEDFKGPAVFLASDASSYVSGETIVVGLNVHVALLKAQNNVLTEVGGWRVDGAIALIASGSLCEYMQGRIGVAISIGKDQMQDDISISRHPVRSMK